ncbi:hypothetical protein HMPREF9958_2026 [Streptococcus mitis SK1073]|uniref:Uncharacterized protein n=1 Tax=Streptococcus mitis SK1073 TaxID=1008452 RepID=F9HBZ5_STRMT|nr:hypothetical protein HMPREF9958_2026 [Streptococcus mitis SK1073]
MYISNRVILGKNSISVENEVNLPIIKQYEVFSTPDTMRFSDF